MTSRSRGDRRGCRRKAVTARGPGEYYASVAHMDYQAGRRLEHLDKLGLRKNTVVVFTSDNGPVTTDQRQWYELNFYGSTGEFRGRKGDLYDGGIRVPALVRWPGQVASGRVTDAPAIGYDLLPILAAIAGVPVTVDRTIDGENLSPVLKGAPFERRQEPSQAGAVRTPALDSPRPPA